MASSPPWPRPEHTTGQYESQAISEERTCRKCAKQFPVNEWQRGSKKDCDDCSPHVKYRGRAERRADR